MSEDFKDQNKFQRFEQEVEILKFLEEGVKSLADTLIWTQDQDDMIQTYLNNIDPNKKSLRCWCPKGVQGDTFLKEMKREVENHFFFNLALPSSNLFFKTSFIKGDNASLYFLIPPCVFKLQRRSFLRLKLTTESEIQFSFQDPVFPESKIVKKMIDLSAGGLSFLVPQLEESLFHPEMKLEAIQFSMQDKNKSDKSNKKNSIRKISCAGEVRYFRPIKKNHEIAGIKIGVRFLQLKDDDIQCIARFVFEESRKHLLRYL